MPDVIDTTYPFRFLGPEDKAILRPRLMPFEADDGDLLFNVGDRGRDVFLLAEGAVDVVEPSGNVRMSVQPGHYFGERAALFEERRRYTARARGAVRGSRLPGDEFLTTFERSPGFAQAFGRILREKHGLFAAFDAFMAKLFRAISEGDLDIDRLVPLYLAMEPALHPNARAEQVDIGALSYAVRRLPANVGTTFLWFLTDDVPPIHGAPDRAFRPIPTAARPRSTWEMLPGKSMVLLRDGISDLIDFLSCLCVFAVECRKIRNRLELPEAMDALSSSDLRSLALSDEERAGLQRIWPDDLPARLRSIALHHEDFTVRLKRQHHNYNSRHSERWVAQIAEAVEALVGADHAKAEVHVISSNTHSVRNCLSPWLAARADEVVAWGESTNHPLLCEKWAIPRDLVYALTRDWMAADPARVAERNVAEQALGLSSLDETAFTGIQVGLVDLRKLAGQAADPLLPPAPNDGRPRVVVNVDFAFGQQASEILGSLMTLFGHRLRSLAVIGKAGALVGARGDVLVPTAFVDQADDTLSTLPASIDMTRLRKALVGRDVHEGPMLTVPGTLLQNRQMLGYYRHLWRCVGLEMEGSHYWRRLDEARRLALVRPDVDVRFLYYVSDVPLDPSGNLSGRLAPGEGIPPLYGITRVILDEVLRTLCC
jgi:hypothetical protein